jgi:GR25 family glycosyltransferase involved in LPS biosynthesis
MDKLNSAYIAQQDFAPIILFAFNRPQHTAITLEALKKAQLANQSDLYVFLDGPRNEEDKQKIAETLNEVQKASGFRKIFIKQRPKNIGLARNIREGIDEVIIDRGSAIILEDDIVVSETFLVFMNSALTHYYSNKKVWHIGAYNEPIDNHDETRTFLWRVMRCWGWATWRDRWAHFSKDPRSLINSFSARDIHRFNLDGHEDFWSQVLANDSKRINTWAIFWYATIFQHNGLCLNPVVSHVKNIGFDSSGVHCGDDLGKHTVEHLNSAATFLFPKEEVEDKEIVDQIKHHYKKFKPTIIKRIANRLIRMVKNGLKVTVK